MFNRIGRKIGASLGALALAGAGIMLTATPANAASGRVVCTAGSVVGMWVDVSGGTDGWATLTGTYDPKIKYWSYNTQGKKWRAFVGCGGTSQNWGSSNQSPWTTKTTADLLCNDIPGYNVCAVG